ncbi:C4-dicarboxylate ABC transporter permease [Oceanispirochaeta crateris]|uniref:C4-dicarboxylate ABC transporter permease n=1 Tax=Oceanispirochaeta crateris TaxID=2518645 RepID=A0A5C1QJH6_9SPIO|nr:tripartite tricarboxylate transporter permease [Oceanispirochaeta crateris]QEN06744.1 C4-dicarboxylate ABC transporter permease [Oceanispirochaeta crateris]
MEYLIQGLIYVFTPIHFLSLFLGVTGGVIVGAIPGLTGSVGIILALPFIYKMDPGASLIMLSGMFCGSIYGGSISAILISTPGTPSAAATVLDGYPLAMKGEAGKAISVATIASCSGGIISTICLVLIAPQLAKFALRFGPVEYFALMIFGLTIIGSVSGSSLTKGILSGLLGLAISIVGIDPTYGIQRYTFGSIKLLSGFPMLPVLIGLFAISQILTELVDVNKPKITFDQKIKGSVLSLKELKNLFKVIIPSSFLGTFIGIIPGTGGAIASFLAYNEARRFSKTPNEFGKGHLHGIAAPEAANNGTTGGAMVPLLTLGVPGDAVTSVMLGAMMLIGVQPGPLLFKESPQIVNNLFIGLMFAQILLLIIGLAGIRVFPRILKIKKSILFPVILILCFIGSYTLGNSSYNLIVALVFGIIGFFLKKNGYATAPVILGVILGPIAERELCRALTISHGNWGTLFHSYIAIFFYIVSILSIIYSIRSKKKEI